MHTTLYGTINAPLYVYENGEKKLNITDYAIKEFQNKYKDKATAENIFAYCHAVFIVFKNIRNKTNRILKLIIMEFSLIF